MSFVRKLVFIFLLALVAIVVLFFSQRNSAEVSIDFYFTQVESISVWFLTFVSVLAGSLVTVVVLFFDILRVNMNQRKLRKENKRLKRELDSLKAEASSVRDSSDDTLQIEHRGDDDFNSEKDSTEENSGEYEGEKDENL